MGKIENFRHNSIRFEFDNGNSIDAIFGYGTYSDNYDMPSTIEDPLKGFYTFRESTTIESMFNCSEKLKKSIEKKYGEQPLNRISIEDWMDIAYKIKEEIKPTN